MRICAVIRREIASDEKCARSGRLERGARKRSRTSTSPKEPAGLSRLRLPFRHPGPGRRPTLGRGRHTGPRCRRGDRGEQDAVGSRDAAGSCRPLAITTPSTMSASTSANARSRSATATTGPPGSRRIVRGAPGRRGGDRNAGTVSPAARAAAPSRRAAWAKRTVDERSIACDSTPRLRHLSDGFRWLLGWPISPSVPTSLARTRPDLDLVAEAEVLERQGDLVPMPRRALGAGHSVRPSPFGRRRVGSQRAPPRADPPALRPDLQALLPGRVGALRPAARRPAAR